MWKVFAMLNLSNVNMGKNLSIIFFVVSEGRYGFFVLLCKMFERSLLGDLLIVKTPLSTILLFVKCFKCFLYYI